MRILAALLLLLALTATLHATEKPNVLFIAIDDMNDWTTLFNPENPIQTPNLVKLAKRGCFFSQAYCAVPGCNPSRTAILTGYYPTTSGVYNNGQSWRALVPDVVTLPQYFRQQGGYTALGAGKIFHHGHTGADRKDNPSFNEFFKMRIHSGKPAKNLNGFKVRPLASSAFDWGELEAEKHTDEHTVEWVCDKMKTFPKDKPLFLAAGIFRPHLPFWAPPSGRTGRRVPGGARWGWES